MPHKGGQAGITGYDYQLWFTAYQFCKALNDKELLINPEAMTINDPIFDSDGRFIKTITKVNYINDVVVYKDKIPIVYNVKYIAPEDTSWTVNKLIDVGVIKEILEQLKRFPTGKIKFVSQSRCDLFNDIFKRARNVKTIKELPSHLNVKQKKEWNILKTRMKLSDNNLLSISRSVEYKTGYEISDYIGLIISHTNCKFNNSEFIPDTLYVFAAESAKEGKYVDFNNIIKWLAHKNIREISSLTSANLLEDAKKISASLKNWINIFGKLGLSHIKRDEVNKILDWINFPLPENKRPIIIITGKAGCGKSVIVRDLIEELDKRNVISIGIKLDLYDVSNYTEFIRRLNVQEDFEKQINSLAGNGELILIFDQLDSLSLTLSKDRKAIGFYIDLINRLSLIPGIRIILTCRSYDLYYDTSLKVFESEYKIVVGELSRNEVDDVIKYFELTLDKLPEKLGKLLLIPQHLNIFCTIFDNNLRLEGIRTIQDLYNELWDKKILYAPIASGNLRIILSEIVNELSTEQKLNTNKLNFQDRYAKEINYLLSESILIENKNIIQFFHQTFFEYCFARIFVSNKNDLYNYLLTIHQGLFIRSTIINVINYLRSINKKDYLIVLNKLLKSKMIRFHIKYLLYNILGAEEEPLEEEWEIIEKTILSKVKLRPYFIESVMSIYLFNKLKEKGYLLKYLNSSDSKLKQSCETLFFKLEEIAPKEVIKYLLESNDFENNYELIERILFSLKNWDNKESIELFDLIKSRFIDNTNTGHLGIILREAISFHREKVANYLTEYLLKRIIEINASNIHSNIYDYQIEEVFDKLNKMDSELFFQKVLPIVKELIYKTDFGFNGVFVVDAAFYQFEEHESLYSYSKLLIHLNEYSIHLAIKDREKFNSLIVPLKNEKSLTLLGILISGLLINILDFPEIAFELLSNKHLLEDCLLDSGIRNKVMNLLTISYSNFNSAQKDIINETILSIANKKLKRIEERYYKDQPGYQYLNALPENERKQFSSIQKRFLELQRKFGIIIEKKLVQTRFSFVGPPIPKNAYAKMTLDDWLNSFKEYNESTGWGNYFSNKRGFDFGGLEQHSRMFSTFVKNEPDKYYNFIERLINENIAAGYISEGLRGLVEANYNTVKLTELLLKINSSYNCEQIRMSIIQAINFIDNTSSLDRELLEILIDFTLNDPNPTHEVKRVTSFNNSTYKIDLLTSGINSVRGSAIFSMVKLKNAIQFKDYIFDTLEKISHDAALSVRCSAVINLNVLISLDEERIFNIYKLFTEEKNEHILRNSLGCLSYYSKKKFLDIKEELKACANIEDNYGYAKVKYFVGQILMYIYSEGLKGSKKLFNDLYNSSDDIKAGCIYYSTFLLNDRNRTKREKAKFVFMESINSDKEIIHNEYANAFREFKASDFQRYYKFMLEYTHLSKSKKRELHHVLEYLLKCMELYPNECITLLKNIVQNLELNHEELIITEEPINLLIGSYNKIKDYRFENKNIEIAMDIFDILMQMPSFRYYAYKVLDEADYS